MKRLVLIFIALCSLPLHAGEVMLGESDQAAVRAAAGDYAQGWYSGDRERMARSLHENLAKRAYLRDKSGKRQLDQMDKATLLAGNKPENAQRYAKAKKRAEVEILDGFGNAATVKLTMDGWVDYLHLVRDSDGEWRILNVLWEPTP
ncbi:MAG: nuclear transport factor 2 family protein [Rhodanobacteraceae bacterium]|nr:nuclear transport factor 2 family protein [Rhodanobacteraceae bacterium]